MSISELMQAQYRGDRETVARLRAGGHELTVHGAAALGDAERLRAPLDEHALGFNGIAPITGAAATDPSSVDDAVDCVRLLLEAGADPHARQGGAATALHTAATVGRALAFRRERRRSTYAAGLPWSVWGVSGRAPALARGLRAAPG